MKAKKSELMNLNMYVCDGIMWDYFFECCLKQSFSDRFECYSREVTSILAGVRGFISASNCNLNDVNLERIQSLNEEVLKLYIQNVEA